MASNQTGMMSSNSGPTVEACVESDAETAGDRALFWSPVAKKMSHNFPDMSLRYRDDYGELTVFPSVGRSEERDRLEGAPQANSCCDDCHGADGGDPYPWRSHNSSRRRSTKQNARHASRGYRHRDSSPVCDDIPDPDESLYPEVRIPCNNELRERFERRK